MTDLDTTARAIVEQYDADYMKWEEDCEEYAHPDWWSVSPKPSPPSGRLRYAWLNNMRAE